MSLLSQHICPDCGGYTGYPGLKAAKSPYRYYTACKCDPRLVELAKESAEQWVQLTEVEHLGPGSIAA